VARLTIYSQQHVYRAGLRCLLSASKIADSITECSEGFELVSHVGASQPDVAILELDEGFDLQRLEDLHRAAPECRFLLIAGNVTPELLYHISESSRQCVVSNRAPLETFLEMLREVIDGNCRVVPNPLPGSGSGERIPLTPRERELVCLLAQGLKNKEIASALNISEGTVKVYLSRLFQKVHVKDRFELALFGLRNMSMLGGGLMNQDQPSRLAPASTDRKGALILDWNHAPALRMRTPAKRREASA
jgi:DNA-binding NarL/FixJ family response regulator